MTNYSDQPGHVRVDFFKPDTGKWYMTETLDMTEFYDEPLVQNAVRGALAKTRHGANAESHWVIVVMQPYHLRSIPVMLTPGRASYEPWPTEYVPMGGK